MFRFFPFVIALSQICVTISMAAPPDIAFEALCRDQHREPDIFLNAAIADSRNEALPPEKRAKCALLAGRLILLYRERPAVHSISSGHDAHALLRTAMKLAPHNRIAASAVTALAAEAVERADYRKAAEIVETFLPEFHPADSRARTALLLLAGNLAIADGNRYADAVRYFEAALDAGILNDIIRCNTIYRIGMIHALKLQDPQRAKHWFHIYLERYPYSFDSALIRANLKKLEAAE